MEELDGGGSSVVEVIEIDPVTTKKHQRIEKERKELLESLASGDFSSLKVKVAAILNLYPSSRNSDVTLAIKLWEEFQPEIYKESGILPKDLFKLERMQYIVRARAKIQNEYGLFKADESIKNHRRKNEESMKDAVLQDITQRRVIQVFADETGKTQKYVSVAAIWVLNGKAVFDIALKINAWKNQSVWNGKEIHFSDFKKHDIEPLREYLSIIVNNREFLSFKVIAIERAKTKRKIEEVVEKLHEHMLILGAQHEINTKRVDLPRDITVTIDEEDSLDAFILSEMKSRISLQYENLYNNSLTLSSLQSVSSKNSHLIQLADIVAGAINRKLNHVLERNFKDDMADLIINSLELELSESNVDELDATALFKM